MSQNEKGINNSLVGIKNENYINILKNENIELDNKLKKVNQLVSKLKIQISENEKQKNLILTTSNQKEIDLQNIKKQLEHPYHHQGRWLQVPSKSSPSKFCIILSRVILTLLSQLISCSHC